jgi:hypothetical protein
MAVLQRLMSTGAAPDSVGVDLSFCILDYCRPGWCGVGVPHATSSIEQLHVTSRYQLAIGRERVVLGSRVIRWT